MSSTSHPISPHRFTEAIKELPLSNLHFKAAEIRNSILHLESSNQQLESFANEGDRDCAEAIQENKSVIQRMEQRIKLLRGEVENRGFEWGEDGSEKDDVKMNGNGNRNGHVDIQSVAEGAEHRTGPAGGSLGDEELARKLIEQMNEDEDESEGGGGMHL